MARSIPAAPQPPPRSQGSRHQIEQYPIWLVTPMFGGGVNAGEPDLKQPFRASSIRGHLRFWWRATVGAQYETVEGLREREAAIWGSTESPSKISLSVVESAPGNLKPCARWTPGRFQPEWYEPFSRGYRKEPAALPYFAFPFQGTDPSRPGAKSPASYVFPDNPKKPAFSLRCTFTKDVAADLQTALRAWIAFGGLGARTRRGFGSLFAPGISLSLPDLQAAAMLARFPSLAQNRRRSWPTLGRHLCYQELPDQSLECWRFLADLYKYLRQGVGLGRQPGSRSPGRSYWPEPETIRRATGQRFPKHPREPHIPDDAAPRAAFGLPINTSFHPQQAGRSIDDDPHPTAWLPIVDDRVLDRWASSLLLKPLAVAPQSGVPLVAVLNGPEISNVALVDVTRPMPDGEPRVLESFGSTQICNARLADYRDKRKENVSPLCGASTTGNAIDAFIALFKETCEDSFRRINP